MYKFGGGAYPAKAAGTGQAAQAKTGPLFRPLDMVMVVKCVDGRPILLACDKEQLNDQWI